jgi:transcription factor E2F3
MSNIPFRTPVSVKGGRTYNKSKASKGSGAGPQTPVSKAGEEMYLSTLQVLLHPFFML